MAHSLLTLLIALNFCSVLSNQIDDDQPVPVHKIHVSVGERVELACDVTTSVANWDETPPDAARSSPYPHDSLRDSGRKANGRSASSAGRNRIRHHNYESDWHDHDDDDAANNGGNNDGQEEEKDEEGAYLVLWFIDPDRKPIYSFDVRGRKVNMGRHWWDERRFGKRAHFLLASANRVARLQISNVSRSDAGHYRCRVDYRNAPTRNFKYHLIVVEPPSAVMILDSTHQQLSTVAGPLEEGSDLILTCKAVGGHPQPWVTWWQGGQLLDNVTDARTQDSVSNLLVVPRINRRHLHDAFTCQVTSSPHVAPIMKTVTLELHLRPLFVEILLPTKALMAETNLEVKCQTAGSRPPPSITWWKGSKQIHHQSSTMTSDDGNLTVSTLTLTPGAHDDNNHLICRVKNTMLIGAILEDSIRLDVQYVPVVRIALGSNIHGEEIKEGDDLYIECHIRANPVFHRLQWSHNGVLLSHNISAGVVLSNVSLVLRAVTNARAGLYTCTAINSRGESTSEPLSLRIQYAPRCRSSVATVTGISRQEAAPLNCYVDADPPDVHFWWTFLGTPMKSNGTMLVTSGGDALLLDRSLFSSRGTDSVLRYSPKSELDFGVVACWASNTVGNQRDPCLFHVVPAGKPAAPSNCAVANQTADSVRVGCQEAFDGGLQQTFGLELVDRDTRAIRYYFNNSKPIFTVYGLEPETAFLLNIFALNAKGRSNQITLETTTLRAAEKHIGQALQFQMTPLLGILVGAAATLVLIVIGVAGVVHCRQKKKRRRLQHQAEQSKNAPPSDAPGSTLNRTSASYAAYATQQGNGSTVKSSGQAQYNHKSTSSSNHSFQKDPDIILTDMDFQMKRVLPVALEQKSATLGRGGVGFVNGMGAHRRDISPDDDESYWHRPADLNLRHSNHIQTLPRNHGPSLNGLRHKDILSDCHLPESSL